MRKIFFTKEEVKALQGERKTKKTGRIKKLDQADDKFWCKIKFGHSVFALGAPAERISVG